MQPQQQMHNQREKGIHNMALTPMQTALCNKLESDYAALVAPVRSVEQLYKKNMSDLDTFTRGMAFSNPVDLDGALNEFSSQVQSMIPTADLAGIGELIDFMQGCPYFEDVFPATAVAGTKAGVFGKITGLVSDLIPSFPEFGAGAIADAINGLLSGVGIPGGSDISDIMKKANKLLNCLSSACGSEYSGAVAEISDDMDSIYSGFNIIESGENEGKFDFAKFYTNSGLDASQQNALSLVTSSIGDQKKAANTAIQNSITSAKNFKKNAGGLF